MNILQREGVPGGHSQKWRLSLHVVLLSTSVSPSLPPTYTPLLPPLPLPALSLLPPPSLPPLPSSASLSRLPYLLQGHWELAEVGDGCNTGTVLGKLLQSTLELVQGCQPKEVHFVVGSFLQRLENISQGHTERHVTVGGKGREGGREGRRDREGGR